MPLLTVWVDIDAYLQHYLRYYHVAVILSLTGDLVHFANNAGNIRSMIIIEMAKILFFLSMKR